MSYVQNKFLPKENASQAEIEQADEWYIIRTPGDKVFKASHLLNRIGFVTWAPLQVRFRKLGPSRFKGRMVPSHYPAFFNYLFVGCNRGGIDWALLFETGFVRAVVVTASRHSVLPVCFSPMEVLTMRNKLASAKFDRRRMPVESTALPVAPGDQVRIIRDKMWCGHEVRIKSIENGALKVFKEIYGSTLQFEVALDAVVKC